MLEQTDNAHFGLDTGKDQLGSLLLISLIFLVPD